MSDESAEKPSKRRGGNWAVTDEPQEEFIAPEAEPSASATEAPLPPPEHEKAPLKKDDAGE